MSESDTVSIVLDNGSYIIKGGFSGDDSPRAVFPTIVGSQELAGDQRQYFIGDAAASRLSTLAVSRPMEDGVIINWDDMERIWHHIFDNELRIQSDGQPLFVTEKVINATTNRDKMAEVLFEKFNVPSCAVMSSALPGLCASGRTCGLVVDSGRDVTTVTPLQDCHVIHDGLRSMNIGGSHVTTYLGNLLSKRGYTFISTAENWAVDEMKRLLCYIASDPSHVTSSGTCPPKEFQMPSGSNITLVNERHLAPECLFNPSVIENQSLGLPQLIHQSIQCCDASVRKELYANILLVGSNTMFSGIGERLTKEMKLLAPADTVVKVVAPPERKSSVWIGGSILTSLDFGQTMWITRHQYQESGSIALHTDWEPPPGLGDMS